MDPGTGNLDSTASPDALSTTAVDTANTKTEKKKRKRLCGAEKKKRQRLRAQEETTGAANPPVSLLDTSTLPAFVSVAPVRHTSPHPSPSDYDHPRTPSASPRITSVMTVVDVPRYTPPHARRTFSPSPEPERVTDSSPPPLPPSEWPEHVREFVYGRNPPPYARPGYRGEPALALAADDDPVPLRAMLERVQRSWADDVPDPVNNRPREPERWAALRNPAAHPWRSLRRRKRRLRGSSSWIPADAAYERGSELPPPAPILRVHAHPPSRSPPRAYTSIATQTTPPVSTPAKYDNTAYELDVSAPVCTMSPLAGPAPPPPTHLLPARTAYGVVDTGVALVCARELPNMQTMLRKLLLYAFADTIPGHSGPAILIPDHPVSSWVRRRVMVLPPDRLVFLATITHIMDLDEGLRSFVLPAIQNFLDDWIGPMDGSEIS